MLGISQEKCCFENTSSITLQNTLECQPNDYTAKEPENIFEHEIPVFRPSWEEFQDFQKYIEKIEPLAQHIGLCKIIAPKEWKAPDFSKVLPVKGTLERLEEPRPKCEYDKNQLEELINKTQVYRTNRQEFVQGNVKGCFYQENSPIGKKMSIQEFQNFSSKFPNRPPLLVKNRPHRGDKIEQENHGSQYPGLEKYYWDHLNHLISYYGSDLAGSLFPESFEEWNIAKLPNLLSKLGIEVPGVNTPYLYFGCWGATFAWHLEDMDLFSINYLHFGEPKQWYCIPPAYGKDFERFFSQTFPESRRCDQYLRHKTTLIMPSLLAEQKIPVKKITQFAGEIMITFPYAYHAGFNYGFNCAESVNFAISSWIGIGKKAKTCHCSRNSVVIDVNTLIKNLEHNQKSVALLPKKRKLPDFIPDLELKPSVKVKRIIFTATKKVDRCILCLKPDLPGFPLHEFAESNSLKAHMICALNVPETFVDENNVIHGFDDIPNERWKLRCMFCWSNKGKDYESSLRGACVQCSHLNCCKSFHVLCAIRNGKFNPTCPVHE